MMLQDFDPASRLTSVIATIGTIPAPLALPDVWVCKSALQKAIRRGDAELAARAALTLYAMDPTTLWPRLMVIGFEDVGLGDLEAVRTATAATSARWRKAMGGDIMVAVVVARALAEAAKCRATEGLAGAAANHPSLAHCRRLVTGLSIPERLVMVADSSLPLGERAVAAWYASGVDHWRHHRVGRGDLPALMATYRNLGVPDPVLDMTAMAIRRVKEPIFVMLPLLALVADSGTVVDVPLPPMSRVGDVPLPALDMFCRLGRQAISAFSTSTPAVSNLLRDYLLRRHWPAAAGYAVFYAQGGRVNPRRMWKRSLEIEHLGIEADFATIGFPAEAISDLLDTVEAQLPHLDAIRAGMLQSA